MTEEFISPLAMLRRLRFMTQQELADALGVSKTTIRNWEKGRVVPELTIRQTKKLCKILGVTLDQLPDDLGPQPIHNTTTSGE